MNGAKNSASLVFVGIRKGKTIYIVTFVKNGKKEKCGMEKMFEKISTCTLEELLRTTEILSNQIENTEDAEILIRMLWKRVPELTVEQEKELHKLGRKIRKKFNMQPIRE